MSEKIQLGMLGEPDRVVNIPAPTVEPDEIKKRVGEMLANARKALDYSQEDIAKRLGWCRVPVSRMETGKRSITLEEVPIICWAYCISSKELFASLYD